MNVNSNGYTFGFAGVMVILVAAILSFTAISLKDRQKKNIDLEIKQNILRSIGVQVERSEADKAFDDYIKRSLVVKNNQPVEGIDALSVNLADEIKKRPEDRLNPLFVAEKEGQKFYIIPLRGKGLWGPIWGYIALMDDIETVYGVTFDHKSETPGLGAEINTAGFQSQFRNKKIMRSGEFVSIEVRKGDASGDHQVNGISGGTITSVGVDAMLRDILANYVEFLKSGNI
ncbi:NADH:ubiquinone reductase (Na(+)-transporting) subunit C [Schleiferia thermophila]|jgi:Na+-transporting NADH:ubiquinone oxidoreductase subunit C|uniref:Na(+)-translocating NADH-quinone reductase subunit C n=1 Tax=Schleiferia thermophila TaxID=884107 RepID=A0A369A6L2_9FLAO|nr:NADH:ubiquinone reductase (Na(+)-transporting) subunit C [Schleiferia thermophila]KFD38909.1 NADH-quinone reductase [Schleiferia thermophila str. Yellowstone]RCX03717.1 Na+-transporting NADH:ubiquinone oxidoreductase subunit C [Schleiferia thermophila]GCD79951.1 Na(+)-translocating NADH-quinone reductase subunit C [Schleiferia thermophila]